MFWKKTLEKQRTKRCFGKKPWKNNARNDVLEKKLGKTTRETMFWKKASQKQRAKRHSVFKTMQNVCAGSILLCFTIFFSCLLALPIGK